MVLGAGLKGTEHIAPTGIRSPDRPARCYPQYKHSDSRAVPHFKKVKLPLPVLPTTSPSFCISWPLEMYRQAVPTVGALRNSPEERRHEHQSVNCVKRKVQFRSVDAACLLTVRLYVCASHVGSWILSLQNGLSRYAATDT